MNLKERIDLLVKLNDYFLLNNEALENVKHAAYLQNLWFNKTFVDTAIENIRKNFLQRNLLEEWVKSYDLPERNIVDKTVGIIMAGNIPLVGFHDFLCVFISGFTAKIKPSSKDTVLIKHIAEKFFEWNEESKNYIILADNLKNCDAYIATGSNNSGRYFEYYFSKHPSIIRRNKTSVAVLNGSETKEELNALANDIQLYYGLGCRNVTKLYVPLNYDFVPLLDALKSYDYFVDFHKYKNNYDYQLALLILNNKFYMTNESILLTQDESIFSAVSRLNYEYYTMSEDALIELLQSNADIQCIVAKNAVAFGSSQSPKLTDYADGIDTMQFLKQL